MNERMNDVILSGNNMDLNGDLKRYVHEKMDRLFTHENHIIRIRVELAYNQNITRQNEYIAKGHIEIKGPPLIATVESEDMYKSIDDLTDKLDRMLRRRSRLRKVKRKNKHDVEIPADIPKVRDVA